MSSWFARSAQHTHSLGESLGRGIRCIFCLRYRSILAPHVSEVYGILLKALSTSLFALCIPCPERPDRQLQRESEMKRALGYAKCLARKSSEAAAGRGQNFTFVFVEEFSQLLQFLWHKELVILRECCCCSGYLHTRGASIARLWPLWHRMHCKGSTMVASI